MKLSVISHTSFAPVLALMGVLANSGCGGDTIVKNKRRGALDATAVPTIAMNVTSNLRDNLRTNGAKHSLKTTLTTQNLQGSTLQTALSKFIMNVKVVGPSGVNIPVLDSQLKPVVNGDQTGADASWEILLADSNGSADGVYTVSVAATPPVGLKLGAVKLPEKWVAKVTLDSAQPTISVRSDVSRSLADGSRSVTAFAWVTNKENASCDTGELRTSDVTKMLPLKFTQVADEDTAKKLDIQAGTSVAMVQGVAVPKDFADPFTLYVKCTDKAGNSAEYIQPVGVTLPKFALSAAIVGTDAKIQGTDRMIKFVKSGLVEVDLKLVDSTTGKPLSAEFAESVASTLRVSVTDKAPLNIDDLNAMKTVIWTQPFADSASFILPSSFDGEKKIYVNLTAQDIAVNKSILVGTVPVDLYVVTSQPSVSWTSAAQFVPFVAKASLSGKFTVYTKQAPLVDINPLSLEYSTDNSAWTELAAQFSLDGAQTSADTKTFKFVTAYPLATEQAFRVRVKARDVAGNVAASGLSPNLIGTAGLALTVNQTERDSCAAGGAAQSKFKPWLASKVLCQFADILGQRSGPYNAQLLLQNRGGAAVSFYSTPTIPPGMGYKVYADGVQVAQNRYLGPVVNGVPQPPESFSLSTTNVRLFSFAIEPQWLQASRVVIQFDVEDSGANSIANSCYAQGMNYPEVVVQDKAAGFTPIMGAMPCDGA